MNSTDSYYDLTPAQRDAIADSPCHADSDDDFDFTNDPDDASPYTGEDYLADA